MPHTKSTDSPITPLQAMAELDDQWVTFAERNAFVGEAYARLLADHPNVAAEVIQGAERQIMQLRKQHRQYGQQLVALRHQIKQK